MSPARSLTLCLAAAACLAAAHAGTAGPAPETIVVRADRPGAGIAPTMFGLFFEDINFGADGGLYAELVKNRSFEFPAPLLGWRVPGGLPAARAVDYETPPGAGQRRYLRLAGVIENEGFRGIGVRAGKEYRLALRARAAEGRPAGLRVQVVSAEGRPLAEARLRGLGADWREHSALLRASAEEARCRLVLSVDGPGAADVDDVSLFPVDTWNRRPNGLRADLVQLLKDLRPGFLRFPGGCIVEGRNLALRYQWKTTVGDLPDRRLLINRWNDELRHRLTPDYFQSFGLGFYEYFLLCEDLGAEPLPVLNCGMACQFNTGELAPLDQMGPYVQDALDLVEFANGPVTSRWGGLRARMGHPRPFGMNYLGIGNEQWGPDYIPRYEAFSRALKAKHPEIMLVGSAGPGPAGERFDFLWQRMREAKADLVDEHYYMPPRWFRENAGRYDRYPRTGPKVFAGEYAAQSVGVVRPENRNDWECALSEAAFLTGLERNADVVTMTSYAPLLAHVDAWQWTPNLIWFDNLRSFGTPSYYVQKLFSTNRGSRVLPVDLPGGASNGAGGLYASASRDDRTGEVILKLVNTEARPREVRVETPGAPSRAARATLLTSPDLRAENSLAAPRRVAPRDLPLSRARGGWALRLEPHAVAVLQL